MRIKKPIFGVIIIDKKERVIIIQSKNLNLRIENLEIPKNLNLDCQELVIDQSKVKRYKKATTLSKHIDRILVPLYNFLTIQKNKLEKLSSKQIKEIRVKLVQKLSEMLNV